IEDNMAGRQLHHMTAISVLDDKLTAIILIRIAEEESARNIGADAMRRAGHTENRIVHMVAIGAAALIAIEAWRQNLERQRGGHEAIIAAQTLKNEVTQLAGQRIIGRKLQIGLHLCGEITRRGAAILPTRLFQH